MIQLTSKTTHSPIRNKDSDLCKKKAKKVFIQSSTLGTSPMQESSENYFGLVVMKHQSSVQYRIPRSV
jgi:hypothetical protein